MLLSYNFSVDDKISPVFNTKGLSITYQTCLRLFFGLSINLTIKRSLGKICCHVLPSHAGTVSQLTYQYPSARPFALLHILLADQILALRSNRWLVVLCLRPCDWETLPDLLRPPHRTTRSNDRPRPGT